MTISFDEWKELNEAKQANQANQEENSKSVDDTHKDNSSVNENNHVSSVMPFDEFLESGLTTKKGYGQVFLAEAREIFPDITEEQIDECLAQYNALSDKEKQELEEAFAEKEVDEILHEVSSPNTGRRAVGWSSGAKKNFIGLSGAVAGAMVGGIPGAIAGFIIAKVTKLFVTSMWRNRRAIGLRWGGAIKKSTQQHVLELYEQAARSLIIKRDLAIKMDVSRGRIVFTSEYVLPKKQKAVIELIVNEDAVSIVPHNTGGSMSLDRINFNNGTIDIPNANMFGGNDFVGNDYKIPKRALNYQQDLIKIWWIVVDMFSELLADFAEYFTDIVRKLQAHKKADIQVFIDTLIRVDLTSDYMSPNDPEVMKAFRDKYKNKPITNSMV